MQIPGQIPLQRVYLEGQEMEPGVYVLTKIFPP
jgi:hypothetical protein